MNLNLQRFGLVVLVCAGVSLVVTVFNGWSVPLFIELGSYVGAASLLLGCWRLTNSSNDAVNQVHMLQSGQNMEAERLGQAAPHTSIVAPFLSSGPLAFGGLFWLLLLQTTRYGFGIVLP